MEWATSCPPPRHNFTSIPRIRSESPAFDLHHPEVAAADAALHGHEAEPVLAGVVEGSADTSSAPRADKEG